MAAALLCQHLQRAGIQTDVTSAGIDATTSPVSRDAVTAMQQWGVDLSQHTPRQVTPSILAADGSDLIITMARDQLRRLVAADRRTWVRTFTLKELVRSIEGLTPAPGTHFEAWAAAIIRRRRGVDLIDDHPVDDLDDVHGRGVAAASGLADRIHDLTAALIPGVPWH
jgi:protein-tyrosine-phosphatase